MPNVHNAAAQQFRATLAKPEIMVVPGAGSPMDLRVIERTGFGAAYISGYATAALRYGLPDIGLIAFNETSEMLRASRQVTTIPLIVDCDTGYGDVAGVRHTIRALENLGAAAVQLEDQTWPKRCGHMDGKIVETEEVAVRKIAAAVASRQSDLVIIARTDSSQQYGIEAAVRRCQRFRDAGADVVFVDGPESVEELEYICETLKGGGPVMVNMSESGKTPILPTEELQRMGFKIAIFPSSSARLCVRVVSDFYADLKATGDSRPWINRMATLGDTNETLGLNAIRDFETALLTR